MNSLCWLRAVAALGFLAVVHQARAQLQTVFMIGTDNGATSEFEQEAAALNNYYWENGDYSVAGLGGVNWTSGMEPWINGAADVGFPRALTSGYLQTNIFFNLDGTEAGPNQPLRLTLDLTGLKANTTHDLEARLNTSAAPFWTASGIAADTVVTVNTTAGAAGARTGANKLILRRTGGQLDAGSAWIQFDYLRLQADPPGDRKCRCNDGWRERFDRPRSGADGSDGLYSDRDEGRPVANPKPYAANQRVGGTLRSWKRQQLACRLQPRGRSRRRLLFRR
jgi:hypothetical protein